MAPEASGYNTVNNAMKDILEIVDEIFKDHLDYNNNTEGELAQSRDYLDEHIR